MITSKNVGYFLFSSMVSGLLDETQIFWHLYLIEMLGLSIGLLHKLKSYEISDRVFDLILSFFSNRRLRVVLEGSSSQEYQFNVGVPQGSIFGATLSS